MTALPPDCLEPKRHLSRLEIRLRLARNGHITRRSLAFDRDVCTSLNLPSYDKKSSGVTSAWAACRILKTTTKLPRMMNSAR